MLLKTLRLVLEAISGTLVAAVVILNRAALKGPPEALAALAVFVLACAMVVGTITLARSSSS